MCSGIAVDWRALTEEQSDRYQLQKRLVVRGEGAEREFRFLYRDKTPQLPVWIGNDLTICTWGNRDNQLSRLPRTGWCRRESLEEGKWRWLHPELVEIPACFGLEKGVWFQVKEGMRGVLVRDEREQPHIYILTEPASHYYEVMTRHDRMPVLIGDRI